MVRRRPRKYIFTSVYQILKYTRTRETERSIRPGNGCNILSKSGGSSVESYLTFPVRVPWSLIVFNGWVCSVDLSKTYGTTDPVWDSTTLGGETPPNFPKPVIGGESRGRLRVPIRLNSRWVVLPPPPRRTFDTTPVWTESLFVFRFVWVSLHGLWLFWLFQQLLDWERGFISRGGKRCSLICLCT